MTVELGDEFRVSVAGTERSGRVVSVSLSGSVADPDEVTIKLNTDVQFTIPWEDYKDK